MFDLRVVNLNNFADAKREIMEIGADEMGVKIMTPKAVFRAVKIRNLPAVVANIVKQEMLSKGGEVAVTRAAANESSDKSDVLVLGTVRQFRELICKLKMQPFKMPLLAQEIAVLLEDYEGRGLGVLKCRSYELPVGERTIIMGILNITPDSFSDGGRFFDLEIAVRHAHEMVEQGADIIDIGAESTRPNATLLSAEEEMDRLLPVLEKLVQELDVPISVDTYKGKVAREAMKIGAHILNDIWGLQKDPTVAEVAAEYDAPLILMHNQHGTEYRDLMGEVIATLRQSVKVAMDRGVPRENLVIDPGIGFGKTYEHNLEVMKRLPELRSLGLPVLLGTSRKSIIGNTLNLPVTERVEGTAATVALGIAYGADIIRIHDVKEMARVAKMTDAMVRRQLNG